MKTHRTDGLSLTFGVVFLVIAAWWAVAATVDLTLPNAGWFVAAALIGLGVLGLIGALRAGRPAPSQPLPDEPAGTDRTVTDLDRDPGRRPPGPSLD